MRGLEIDHRVPAHQETSSGTAHWTTLQWTTSGLDLGPHVALTVTEYLELEVAVEAVQVEPEEENPPTLTYVFVQPGDTIWKLARRYHTTEEKILVYNPKLQDDPLLLRPGERLFIPRA